MRSGAPEYRDVLARLRGQTLEFRKRTNGFWMKNPLPSGEVYAPLCVIAASGAFAARALWFFRQNAALGSGLNCDQRWLLTFAFKPGLLRAQDCELRSLHRHFFALTSVVFPYPACDFPLPSIDRPYHSDRKQSHTPQSPFSADNLEIAIKRATSKQNARPLLACIRSVKLRVRDAARLEPNMAARSDLCRNTKT